MSNDCRFVAEMASCSMMNRSTEGKTSSHRQSHNQPAALRRFSTFEKLQSSTSTSKTMSEAEKKWKEFEARFSVPQAHVDQPVKESTFKVEYAKSARSTVLFIFELTFSP